MTKFDLKTVIGQLKPVFIDHKLSTAELDNIASASELCTPEEQPLQWSRLEDELNSVCHVFRKSKSFKEMSIHGKKMTAVVISKSGFETRLLTIDVDQPNKKEDQPCSFSILSLNEM